MPFGLAMTAALMARGAGLSALGGLVCGVMLRGDGFHGGIYAAAAAGAVRDERVRRSARDVRAVVCTRCSNVLQARRVHSCFCRSAQS